jgi:hypothetical protein
MTGQWEDVGDDESKKGDAKDELTFGAVFFFDVSGRSVKCTHCRGPGGPAAVLVTPYQHSQVNQDASSYLSHYVLALAGRAKWSPMADLEVTGEFRVGTVQTTLNYEVGPGSPWNWAGDHDMSTHLDTRMGFPWFGWEVEGRYRITDDLWAFGGWNFAYGTGSFGATVFGWAIGRGYYSFTEHDLYVGARYDLDVAVPFFGFSTTFHNGWAYFESTATGSDSEWWLDYRETGWLTVFLGAYKEFDGGHYVRMTFSFFGEFSANFTVGYLL